MRTMFRTHASKALSAAASAALALALCSCSAGDGGNGQASSSGAFEAFPPAVGDAQVLALGDSVEVDAFPASPEDWPEGEDEDEAGDVFLTLTVSNCQACPAVPEGLDAASLYYDEVRDAFNRDEGAWTIGADGSLSEGYFFLLFDVTYANGNPFDCKAFVETQVTGLDEGGYDTLSGDDTVYVEGGRADSKDFLTVAVPAGRSVSLQVGAVADEALVESGRAKLMVSSRMVGVQQQGIKAYALGEVPRA